MRTAVVGAGFSGLISAIKLSEVSEVTLFEEHDEVGMPEHCTGVVSGNVVERLGDVGKESLEGYLSEFFVGTPDGLGVRLVGPKDFAAKLDRKRLEELMLEDALSRGVKLVKKVVRSVTQRGSVDGEKFDRVVIAEGWRAELSHKLRIGNYSRKVYGINLEVVGRVSEPGTATIWFDERLAPGFFAWVVQLEGKAVVGTGAKRGYNVRKLAFEVLKRAEERGLVKGEVKKVYGGVVLTGPPVAFPCVGKVCSTGDAAGLNKPLTGGGLHPSLTVAEGFRKHFPHLLRAYYPLVLRLKLETPLAHKVHEGGDKLYRRLFAELNGVEIRVSEYDNHVKTALEVVKELGLTKSLKLLGALLHPL